MLSCRQVLSLVAVVLGAAVAVSASASSPAGRYAVTDGTVRDTRTGRTWQRHIDPAHGVTWAGAAVYCQSLDVEGRGWRLPTVKELLSIVDVRVVDPAIDATAFPEAVAASWSATRWSMNPQYAYVVLFSGFESHSDLFFATDQNQIVQVRCVR